MFSLMVNAMYDFFVEEAARINSIERFDYKQDLFNSLMEADNIRSYVNNIFIVESISEVNIISSIYELLKKAFGAIIKAIGTFCGKLKSLFSKDKKIIEAAEKASKMPETEEMKKKEEESTAEYTVHSVRDSDRKNALSLAEKVSVDEIYDYAAKHKSSDGLDEYILNKVDTFKTHRYVLAAEYTYFPKVAQKYSLSEAKANTHTFTDQLRELGFFNLNFDKKSKKALDAELAAAKAHSKSLDETNKADYYSACFNRFSIYKREIFRGITNSMIAEYKELKKVLTAIGAGYLDMAVDLNRDPEPPHFND